jgi:hypothetical protein
MEAFSLKSAYLTCIGEQLQKALNDIRRLGKIYIGLSHYILAKYGGSLHLPHIQYSHCIRSPTTRTLFLLTPKGPKAIFRPFLKFGQAIVKAIFIKNS